MATITAASVRTAIKAIVEARGTYQNWYSEWSNAKERTSPKNYGAVYWYEWTTKHPKDPMGQLMHQQMATLVICKSVATDRTSAVREQVVEEAHAAAVAIVQALLTNPAFTIDNIVCTSQFDEFTELETGVVLLFTVTGLAAC